MTAKDRAKEMLDNLAKRKGLKRKPTIKSCKIFRQGNFTGALINDKYLGMAKRNCGDDPKRTVTGESFAINRAIRSMLE